MIVRTLLSSWQQQSQSRSCIIVEETTEHRSVRLNLHSTRFRQALSIPTTAQAESRLRATPASLRSAASPFDLAAAGHSECSIGQVDSIDQQKIRYQKMRIIVIENHEHAIARLSLLDSVYTCRLSSQPSSAARRAAFITTSQNRRWEPVVYIVNSASKRVAAFP
jgi:hypothetical protein